MPYIYFFYICILNAVAQFLCIYIYVFIVSIMKCALFFFCVFKLGLYLQLSYIIEHVFEFIMLTDALQVGASQFEASAGKLKRKMWWKNIKVSHIGILKAIIHTTSSVMLVNVIMLNFHSFYCYVKSN